MKDLEHLILSLQKSIAKRDPHIKSIRNPSLLLKSLKELDALIGNHNIKESVASQVSHLIVSQGRKVKNNDLMLNALIVGTPGCGKTLVGTILAKIWYSLGFLKGGKPKSQNLPSFTDQFKNTTSEDNPMFNVFLLVAFLWLVGLTWSFYSNYGGLMTMVLIFTLFVVLVAIFYYYQNNDKKNIDEKTIKNYNIPEHIPDDDIIRIVSRSDLVGSFCGSTALKTRKLLEENLGKVLFIDEAYSLYQSREDSFGAECLNELNLFMSMHPDEIIIIFAGYLDKIEEGPFRQQVGLKRRFMWQFKCEGYDSSELFEIFKTKTTKEEWILEKPHEMKKLFDEYYDAFGNYGGDCQKVLYFSTLEHSAEFINANEDDDIDINILKVEHVRKGIMKLMENSITGQPESKNLTQEECDDITETLKHYMQKRCCN